MLGCHRMSLLTADRISIAFGPRVILDGASFALQPGDRVGLVGPNGSGKTTLLRILAGEREPDDGEVLWARGVRAGYLPQDILELPPGTLVESVLSVVPGHDRLQARLGEVESELTAARDDEERLELAGRLAGLHEELAHFEAHHGRHRAEEILQGLGFSTADLERPIAVFSGGWKMRAALAGLLLLDPELLLLDEPTNHLDVPSLIWFDGFLRRSRKAVLLVSHDRDFLNRQIERVISLETDGVRSYTGNYDAYRVQREEEERNLELRAKREAAQRAEVERFIERFRSKATKARQVQSRIKMLEKQERVVVREVRAKVAFRFPEVARSGREVMKLEGVQKRFGEKVIYRGIDAAIQRGERVAIIGVNGAGKTTLLKILAGELVPDGGAITLGHNVQPAYFAQHHTELLDPRRTILQEISALVPREPPSFVRGVLGAFLFSGEDVDKPIGVLSGGERARVSLARLLVVPSNLMLMDEPTNHLDLDSSERLVEALEGYGGTLVFVSHNRSFVNRLATKVWDVKDGGLTEWPGNLDDYLYHLEQIGEPMGGAPAPARASATGESPKDRRAREAQERSDRAARTRPLRKELAQTEARIAELELEQAGLTRRMNEPDFYDDFTGARAQVERFEKGKAELEKLLERWAELQEALEASPS
jgi:ATP-binding cassette subfamily F protein 3